MQSPFDMVEELSENGMTGPEIAHVMLRDEYDATGVLSALREHGYDVDASFGNEIHLRGVSDHPQGDVRYTPLQRRGTGELALASVGYAVFEGAD